jgi:DNA-binding NtrC family response regulator
MTTRILLVDEDRSIRDALCKVLRDEHYDMLLAECGFEAVERYGSLPVDLLLFDLNTPRRNGCDPLEWLAEVNPLLPVIIISSRPNQDLALERAGADVLMEKPLDVPLLLRTIRRLLDEPLEARVRRAHHRADSLRSRVGDSQVAHRMLAERFTIHVAASAAG